MKIWIDLANSPHPLLFSPVARELEQRGHEVLVTARDNAQTVELTRERWRDFVVIGGESPRSLAPKAVALTRRSLALRRWARSNRPDIALSHNSYAQIVAARALRMPILTAMDFEHQPANHLAFRAADAILVPDVLPRGVIRRQGATRPQAAALRRLQGGALPRRLRAGSLGALAAGCRPGRPNGRWWYCARRRGAPSTTASRTRCSSRC